MIMVMLWWELPWYVEHTKLVEFFSPVCNIFAWPVPNLTTGLTDRRASTESFLTQLAKVGLPFPLSLSQPTDNKWKLDFIYYKQYVVNHLFEVGVGEGISVAEALDYYPGHLFQAQFLWQPFPVAISCLFLLAGQNGISRGRTTARQKGGTERWDKRAFPRDRMAKGQNFWDRRAGTERLGFLIQ